MLQATANLLADEEVALAARAHSGDADAAARLVTAHVRYLRSEARKYAAAEPLIAEDDLVSAGVEALLASIKTFDPTRGARLLTHARPSIGLAMAEEVATTGRVINVPGRTLRKYRKALRETDSIDAARELAHVREGMDYATFDAVHTAMTGGASIDASSDASDTYRGGSAVEFGHPLETGLAHVIADGALGSRGPAPEDNAVARHLSAQALSVLDPRQHEVVRLAYLCGEELTDAEVGERLGLSRPTVTRTRNAALAAMREVLAGAA